jgi:hypothetical protein
MTEQVWPEGTTPVVSVFNWAYNHAEFIRESIESILIQETTFPVEIIIHDDASTDGTREIIEGYAALYPQLFRNIYQAENQYSCGGSVTEHLHKFPRGEFIALAHGDDFWSASGKLQMQFEYLQKNRTCSCCFHLASVVDAKSNVVQPCSFRPRKPYNDTLDCFLELGKQYATNSMVFRRTALEDTPSWMLRQLNDAFLELQLSRHGSIDFIDATMSGYRVHGDGVWSKLGSRERVREQLRRFKLLAKTGWIPLPVLREKIAGCRAILWREKYPLLAGWMDRFQRSLIPPA